MPTMTSGPGVVSGWHQDLGRGWATVACPGHAGTDTCTDGFFSVFPMERDPRFFREFCREKRELSPAAMARHPGADRQTQYGWTSMLTSPAACEPQENTRAPVG